VPEVLAWQYFVHKNRRQHGDIRAIRWKSIFWPQKAAKNSGPIQWPSSHSNARHTDATAEAIPFYQVLKSFALIKKR
jgi:hypothetical protein